MGGFTWDILNSTRMGKYLTAVEYDFISNCLQQETAVHSILDIGGGTGRFAIPLQKEGYKVTIFEVSRGPLPHIKSSNPDIDIAVIGQQTCAWPVGDASVDCILAMEIPIISQSWFWQECYRVLKPGGIVITSSANNVSYKGAFYRLYWILKPLFLGADKKWTGGKFYQFSASDIVQILEKENLQLYSVMGFNWLPAGRGSDSSWLPFFEAIERKLGLRNLAFLSPWVLFKAQKLA